uniref:Nuclear pore complex protein Nup153 n=1 Tax=Strigamia maritima TaxID=126957 RepID=T1IZQ7_STRMM
MYRTKKDVDKHVSDILNKLKNENERNNRGFVFAKMYVLVRDFESAKRYLAGYLSIKERDGTGHKLMGQIHEQTGHLEKALQSYKRSLELEENQKDVVLKICELYCQLPVDPERARYWADRAEALFPNHATIFKLRECIVTADGDQNSQELEDLIAAELTKRPLDAQLRIKLLKLYLDTERVVEAYDHAFLVENKRPYTDCLDWYYCVTDIVEVYLDENGQKITSEFYFNALNAYDRLVYLCLDERGKRNKLSALNNQVTGVGDCAVALQSFDQTLYKACRLPEPRDGWWGAFLNHMSGQLYFHLGTFILKRAKKDHGHANMKEASWISAGLFLAAYSFKPTDLHSLWFVQATEAKRKEYMIMYKESCFRLSQTGHMVIGLCKEDRSKWLQKIKQQVCTPQGRDKILQRFCSSRDASARTSCFVADLTFMDFTPEFPDVKTLKEYDEIAYSLYPDSLHHVVWLALQYYTTKQKIQPDYRFKIFDGLQFSVNNLNTAVPESLCQLDIDAFLHATVQTSALALEERNAGVYGSQEVSTYLPVSISIPLCSDQQATWWSAAYRLFKNLAKENLADMRHTLQHGIEVVRALGLHGIDVMLMVHLAETFAERARELKEQNNNDIWRHLENRAAHYWKTVIAMLEKLSNNQVCRMPKERIFNSSSRDPSTEDVKKLLEEGSFYLACQAMNSNKNEDALEMFDRLKTPYASYYQALIYKKLSSEDFNQPRELITSEMRSKHIILLTKSRDAFYVTLDRIQGNKKHPLNQVLSYEVEEIETKLARIDPDTAQRHAFDALSDECVSSQDSEDQDPESPRPLGTPSRKSQTLHSTPHISVRHDSPDQVLQTRHREEHTRPSPERLDAQVRYLTYSQESMFKQMLGEQTKLYTEQTKMFSSMSGQIVDELKEIKIHLEEIGKQIAATNRLRSGTRKGERGKPLKEVEASENDDYEYENYYYDDDETDESTAHFDYHYSAYKYSDPAQNDYPYGNVTGLHGTSTVTYAPPQAGGRGAQRGTYANYYPNGPQQPMLPGAAPGHVLPPGHLPYFNPGNISTGLPFCEGQKLPEFNFNPAISNVQLAAKPTSNSEIIGKQTVFSRLGPSSKGDVATSFALSTTPAATTTLTTITTTTPTTGFQFQKTIPNQAISTNDGVGIASTTPSVESVTSITTSNQSATAPHAFQITMPPKSSNAASSTFQSIIASPTIEPEFDSKQSSTNGRNRTASGDEEQTEESTGGDFQPVIPLPDEVEVRTGEEEECVLFESRAKLFRFVNKEWKERGIGMLKILFNEKTGRSRILMRRDQVWKICANHFILSNMKLTSMKDNETTWVWAANDFADEKMVMERFCVKFKTAEIAQNFKTEFEKAQEKQSNASPVVAEVRPIEGFGDRFKPKSGTWSCETCLINNNANAKSCVACSTSKPGLLPIPEPAEQKSTPPAKLSPFTWPDTPKGYKTGNSQKFGAESDASVSKLTPLSGPGGFNLASSTTSAKPWSFGIKQEPVATPEKAAGFVFGGTGGTPDSSGGGFVFGATAMKKDDLIQYGGFTFKTSPSIKPIAEKSEERVKTSPPKAKESDTQIAASKSPKPGVFADFSFSKLTKPEVVNEVTKKKGETDLTKPTPFASESRKDDATMTPLSGLTFKTDSGMSFAALASQKPNVDKFKVDPEFKGFKGSGKSVFQSADTSAEDVEAEADLKFEPIVPLPELVEVRTGEEDDNKLFGERARLYRFDSDTQQWKERGIGEIKILENRTTGAFRILMRREQVHKVCANHRIEAYMELTKLLTSDRALSWAAKDFSEEVESDETFAVRFKSQEMAEKFLQVFQDCLKRLKTVKPKVKEPEVDRQSKKDDLPKVQATNGSDAPLSELFKPKEDSWECSTCSVRNDGTNDTCIACNINRTDKIDAAVKKSEIPLSDLFKPKENSWDCSVCFARNNQQDDKCLACQANRLSAGADVKVPDAKVSDASKFSFAAKSEPTFKFGMTTPTKSAPVFKFGGTPEQESIEFKFGTPQNFEFSFSGVRSKSPAKSPKTPEAETAAEADDSVTDDDGDHIFFSPIIPLPDKVDVKTGEEDEDMLYCQRAKLYRLVGKEWKERGLGDFKILKHKDTGKVRFLMRREFVHKVCLNHYFSAELSFVVKDEKSWMWGATDYADNEPVKEVFTLRFKCKDTAKTFMDAVENAKTMTSSATTEVQTSPQTSFSGFSFRKEGLTSPSLNSFSFGSKFGVSTSPSLSIFGGNLSLTPKKLEEVDSVKEIKEKVDRSDEDSDNLLVVYVKEPSEDQKKMAAELLLPPNFYLYVDEPSCSGCRGCHDEDWSFEGKQGVVETGNDFEIVKESKAEPDRVKQAMDLKLPPNFYLYEKKDPCPGCRGCDKCETNEKSNDESKTEAEAEKSTLLFKDSTGLDFANLAKKEGQTFTTQTSPGFAFGTGNVMVFKPPKANDNSDGEDESTPHQPDIHFDPIVPLPDLIEVKTGEEDEDIVFTQRAKLYRYDLDKKEWKERGVGDAKILKHKKTNRYRMILRREQIYKIACNHSITPDMNLSPLATSETAMCWSAMDFAESETGVPEQFAIKFKSIELTKKFEEKFKECQENLRTTQQQLSESTTDTSTYDTSHSSMSDSESLRNDGSQSEKQQHEDASTAKSEEENEGNAADDDDDEDDDADSVMFEKRVSLSSTDGIRGQFNQIGMGNLRVLYDDDFYGARVQVVTDDGQLVCNHLISIQSAVKVDAKKCTWGAEDYSTNHPMHRQFEASFSSADAAKEFEKTFLEGNEYAKQSDIWDQPYNPAGGDNVGDNGTATTGSKDEVKACSPELAAALSEIIRDLDDAGVASPFPSIDSCLPSCSSSNKTWQFEWDNYGSWEAEDQWTTNKYQKFRAKNSMIQENLERAKNCEFEQKNGTDKCLECLIQIPSQEMALHLSTMYCYAMDQLYTSPPQPQPMITLEGNQNQSEQMVVNEGNIDEMCRTLRSQPRTDPSPQFTPYSTQARFKPVSIYGHPIVRDSLSSPDDSHEFASVCSSDSTVYVDPVDEGRMSRNCRKKSQMKTARRNNHSALSFHTVYDSDNDSSSSNEYFFDPIETRSERCLSWLDEMPQFSAKSFNSRPETPGFIPFNTCRHSDGPSICGCQDSRSVRMPITDQKKFYSIVPETGRLTSAVSAPLAYRQMQSSLSHCICSDVPPQSTINTYLPFTATTANTQYLSPDMADSVNWSQPATCKFNSQSALNEKNTTCFERVETFGPMPLVENESNEREVVFSHSKISIRSSECRCSGRPHSSEEVMIKESCSMSPGRRIRSAEPKFIASCSPRNQFSPVKHSVCPLMLEKDLETDFLLSSPEIMSERAMSDDLPLVIVTGPSSDDRFVMNCRRCRHDMGLLSERISSRMKSEKIDQSTSISPTWKLQQDLRQSAGGISPRSRSPTTESGYFVTSQHSPQPILVRRANETPRGIQPVILQVVSNRKSHQTSVQATNTSPEPLVMRICPGKSKKSYLDSAVQCGGDIFHDPYDAGTDMICTISKPSTVELTRRSDSGTKTKPASVQCSIFESRNMESPVALPRSLVAGGSSRRTPVAVVDEGSSRSTETPFGPFVPNFSSSPPPPTPALHQFCAGSPTLHHSPREAVVSQTAPFQPCTCYFCVAHSLTSTLCSACTTILSQQAPLCQCALCKSLVAIPSQQVTAPSCQPTSVPLCPSDQSVGRSSDSVKETLRDAWTQQSTTETQHAEIQCTDDYFKQNLCSRACSPFPCNDEKPEQPSVREPSETLRTSGSWDDSIQLAEELPRNADVQQPEPTFQTSGFHLQSDIGKGGMWDLGTPGRCPVIELDSRSTPPCVWSLGKFVSSTMSKLIANCSPTPSPEACCRSDMSTSDRRYDSPPRDPCYNQVAQTQTCYYESDGKRPQKRKNLASNDGNKCKAVASSCSSEYVTVSEQSEQNLRQDDDFLKFIISLYHNLPNTCGQTDLRAGQDTSDSSPKMYDKLSHSEKKKWKKRMKRKAVWKAKNGQNGNKSSCCCLGFSGMSELISADEDDSSGSSEDCKCKKMKNTSNPGSHRKNRMTVLTPRMSASWGGLNTIFDSIASTSNNNGRQRPRYSYTGRDGAEEKEYYCWPSNSEADTGYG